MNIVHCLVSISRQSGGLFHSVRGLTRSLAALPGLHLQVHGVEDRDTARDLVEWLPLKPLVHRAVGPTALGYAPSMQRALMETRCDLLHTHALWQYPSFLALQWHSRFRRPHLISPRGALDPWALSHSRWKKTLAGFCFENKHLSEATCLHALNVSEARSFRAYGLTNPIAILPNAVDLPTLEIPKTETKKNKTLLFLGRLHPKKGLIPLLKTWAVIQKPDVWSLTIAGWDQRGHETELRRLCRELDIERTVHFHGPAYGADKDRLFRQADAFVLPSLSEGLPMAVLEAWAYGLPVLMTEACNLPEGFVHQAALRLELRDKSLDGLEPLFEMSDTDLREMGSQGHKLVETHYSWPKIASQMNAVYLWMLGEGPIPPSVET